MEKEGPGKGGFSVEISDLGMADGMGDHQSHHQASQKAEGKIEAFFP